MVNTASEPIYPNNANYTTLEFSMKLLEWKNKHNWSNNGFDDLLLLIGLVLPDDHKLPEKYYNMRKMIKRLHMKYEKIDACENDCMLFYKEHSGKTKCDICNEDRYQKQKDPKQQKIPRKILRYFPITMILQHLLMAETIAKAMRWHHDRIPVEGELSHPADGDEWKQFDQRFQRFSNEIRNVRLGLSTDGFYPFRDKHVKEYTVWPVVVVVYNLPPSMCTKAPYMFMPLLIPGPTDPTKDLHVYLRPLIDELKVLWHARVETYDMKAALLWTISDFPGLAMLSGWSTKEKNVFANIFYTILGDGKKTKDNTKSRKDCQELRVHRELWIRGDGTEPHAPYTLLNKQIHKLFKWIESLKLPDGYASNISRCVNWAKNCIRGMKSHDDHIFMQKLLPIVYRDLLPKHVADPIIELCNFFQDLCSSVLKYSDLEKMEKNIVRIMSKLETFLTPGFF
ncbi:uncharacterized protein LOC141680549 [Apium graveolens]|uniref:uncharacterized protein LOC141680549 n=1 Tax=Apium graveolens TaxID=4045 RepID=UPI003D798701